MSVRMEKWDIRFLVVICTALSCNAHALTPDQVFEKVKDSIVVVRVLDESFNDVKLGSGVLLPSGDIGTNCHVLDGGEYFLVGRNGKFVPALPYAGDEDRDICLLESKEITGKPAQLGSSRSLRVGARVYAVGAPEGLELSLSEGLVSQLRGSKIQTSAPISKGSSGGGLFDAEARLIGFTTSTLKSGQNLNFAVPVEWLAYAKPFRTEVAHESKKEAPAMSPPDRGTGIAAQPEPPQPKQSKPRVDIEKPPLPPETRDALIEGYQQRMQAKILAFLRLPPRIEGNPEAVYLVKLLSNGEVAQVDLTKSSGNSAYDAEVERAILKASPLPMPMDRRLASEFTAGISMKFRPFPSGGPSQSTTPIHDPISQPAYAPDNPSFTYPIQAWAGNIQGKAILRVEVLPDGKPGRMWLKQSSGSGVLDRDAQSQVALWRFIPARKDGQPVTSWIDVPVIYRLQDGKQ